MKWAIREGRLGCGAVREGERAGAPGAIAVPGSLALLPHDGVNQEGGLLEPTRCIGAKAGRGTGLCLSLPGSVHAFEPSDG